MAAGDVAWIDAALVGLAPKAAAGDVKAAELALRLMERRDRLREAARRPRRGPIRQATEKALTAAAPWLTEADAGAVEALRAAADRLDRLAGRGGVDAGGSLDNVSAAHYLRLSEELGLTPRSRARRAKERAAPEPAAPDEAPAEPATDEERLAALRAQLGEE
ncbi:MAG: hypothetical protein QM779_08210 [Propionicimonas sp.]|uniref:terminase small subunit n=1 Tax=Propionicimonas sp. TaxID=1955623 RepID=UPI003D13DEED